MSLPFTRDQFLDVFAAYNAAMWPGAVILWAASLVALALFFSGRPTSRAIGLLLALQWAWSALAYHLAYFTRINPAAYLFAALFLLEALLFLAAALRGRITFSAARSWRLGIAAVVCAYAIAYPFVTLLAGHRLPRAPTFGVPCPTTLLTAGLLLTVRPAPPLLLAAIPVGWSLVGGSAAAMLGMAQDWALFVAGGMLVVVTIAGAFARSRPR